MSIAIEKSLRQNIARLQERLSLAAASEALAAEREAHFQRRIATLEKQIADQENELEKFRKGEVSDSEKSKSSSILLYGNIE